MKKEMYEVSKPETPQEKDSETTAMTHVWYAAYGSNMNKARFLIYISRCLDKTPPLEERPYIFSHSIYFASESKTWDHKGVAFLDDTQEGIAYGRVYKITWDQFLDVKRMEGRKYSKQLSLGTIDGFPVYSFTAPTPYSVHKEPSPAYLQVIHDGLKDTYPEMSENFIHAYLETRNLLNKDDLTVLSFIRHSPHGVSIQTMTQSGVPVDRVKVSIQRLHNLNLVKQDGRSVAAGHGTLDLDAVYYTRKGHRKLIDTMLYLLPY